MQYSAPYEAPDKMHFWTGVSTIAGALRRRVWIDQGAFQWTPNFYIILVAKPGIVSKSTTLSIGMNLLKQVDGIKFGPAAVTWQALVTALKDAKEDVLMADGNYHPMSCVTIASSEFGTFLDPNDRGMIDVLVDLWDGQLGVWEKMTKTQGSDSVENPWINIGACTTPGWIASAFPEHLIGGGFTSRCIFVYAEGKRKLVAYPSQNITDERLELQAKLVRDLEVISQLRGAYVLSHEAIAFGTEWYEKHWGSKPKELDNEKFGGYLARKQTHIHKLCIVLAAAESNELIITKDHLHTAIQLVDTLEKDMPRVFDSIGVRGGAKQTQDLIEIVRTYGKMTQTDLFRICCKTMSWKEFVEAVSAATNSKIIDANQGVGGITFTYKG